MKNRPRNSSAASSPTRAWRSVEDTTFDPIIDKRRPQPFQTLNRLEDYYSEGMLVWLEADQIIVVEQGRISAIGPFETLRAESPTLRSTLRIKQL